MKWPLVSRRAYDLALEERDRLRVQVDELLDHVRRIDRVEHGLLEVPHQPPDPPEQIPREVQDHIDGWQDRTVRREILRNVLQARQAGKSWDEIIEEIGQV